MKPIFILFFLFFSHFAIPQDLAVEKELKEIDNLIFYGRLEIVERKTKDLTQRIQSLKKNKAQLLEARFRQAVILDRKNETTVEPLKILLKIQDEAETEKLYALSYRIYLMMALSYEKAGNLDLTKKYLDKAYLFYKKYHLESIFSTYCIRASSYYRFVNDSDSSFHYAKKAKEYAEKFHNETDLKDSYILLGNFAGENNNHYEALKYVSLLLEYSKKIDDNSIGMSYNNISITYFKMKDFPKALLHIDSAYHFYKNQTLNNRPTFSYTKYRIFEEIGNIDSAFYYFKQYHSSLELLQKEEENIKVKKLEEEYQNEKKEAIIKSKNKQMFLISCLLIVIIIATILIIRKNRQINKKNKIINKQLTELSKTLEQKQVLLSELQHRVKNNLQHVISILEIQKESVDFNNIDELIRGNQNRIHSMALLHKKLNVLDNVNDVDLKRYITELSELVKESYENYKKKITLNVECDVEIISIEKALPLGLIITELVSNSMKHAFKKQNIGIITIQITKTETRKQLYYSDNGTGFDFNKTNKKGLGQEIIKGLIDQLSGTINTKEDNGFELIVSFK